MVRVTDDPPDAAGPFGWDVSTLVQRRQGWRPIASIGPTTCEWRCGSPIRGRPV